MYLLAMRQDFDINHQLESRDKKVIKINGVDALELPLNVSRMMEGILWPSNGAFYNDPSTSPLYHSAVAAECADTQFLQKLNQFLDQHKYRWLCMYQE